MKSQEHNRTARIEARIAPEALAVVRRTAEIQGRSITRFWRRRTTGRCTEKRSPE
jgi:uncharacterized protein (DUF1778 family)